MGPASRSVIYDAAETNSVGEPDVSAHKCDVKRNAQTAYGHILTCIPILFRQADVHPSQPNTPGSTHRAKSPLPFQTENIRPPRHKHRKKSSIGNSHTFCNSSAGHPYAGKEKAR